MSRPALRGAGEQDCPVVLAPHVVSSAQPSGGPEEWSKDIQE